jgi:hypothetical protein
MLVAISNTLRTYLTNAIPNTAADWIDVGAFQQESPPTFPTANHLVIFLYAIEENAHLRNRPLEPTDGGYRQPPLALTLHYLITYMSRSATDVQDWLSRVLQAFHTKPRLGPAELDPALAGQVDHLSVRLQAMSPDEVQKLWTALSVGMRLSLYYQVDAAFIPKADEELVPPVVERRFAEVGP